MDNIPPTQAPFSLQLHTFFFLRWQPCSHHKQHQEQTRHVSVKKQHKGHPARIWPKMANLPLNFAIFPLPKFATCRAKIAGKLYWPRASPQNTKMKGNEGPKGQNARK